MHRANGDRLVRARVLPVRDNVEDPDHLYCLNSFCVTCEARSTRRDHDSGVCRLNICYNAADFVISFNLICNMTMF